MKTYGFNAPNQYGFGSDQGLGFVGTEAVPVVPIAPNAPTNFTASDDEYDQITFTWDNSTIGTPTPTYDIMIDGGATIVSGVTSPHTESIAAGTEDYKVRATNSEGFTDSNIDGGTSLAPPVITSAEASAFLSKSTFGATETDINALVVLDDYEGWIDAEVLNTPSYHKDWMETNLIGVPPETDLAITPDDWNDNSDALLYAQRDAWWDITVNGTDQLRQRVAFALSEIMVISKDGPLASEPLSRVTYYDILVENAFGNFSDLLKAVTYSSSMGKYLSYLGNQKEDLTTGRHPDENYAREIMQLFTIGLFELNLDGTQKVDGNLDPIPTYLQEDIEEMAKVFTGLSDQNGFFLPGDGSVTYTSQSEPMIPTESYHDTSEKTVLGQTIPSGGTVEQDIDAAISILVNHDNAAPFLARGLIQRLVMSNPSSAYIARVSAKFVNNGLGVRGDLESVIKAVLTDAEALDQTANEDGKVREPLLVTSNLFRTFSAQNANNTLSFGGTDLYTYDSFHFHGTGYTKQEGALESETVFNYFTPDDAPYSLRLQDLVAPEIKVFNKGIHQLIMGIVNKDGFVYGTYNMTAELDVTAEVALYTAGQYTELIDRLDLLLLAGEIRTATRTGITNYISTATGYTDDEMTRHIIGLVMTSPEYATQR